MSVRRNTENRLNLVRTCQTCGRTFPTTAASPFMRMITNMDGKKQKTCYFCSELCKNASYRHKFDGKAEERRKAKEAARDIAEKNRRYYASHTAQERERVRARYWADHEAGLAAVRYQRKKRKLKEAGLHWL